jgi:hypothetical protein
MNRAGKGLRLLLLMLLAKKMNGQESQDDIRDNP